jgi:hypothetical protein
MNSHGVFGFKIGKKKRMMKVQFDANLLWQILVREIFILMKHYGTKETLQIAFEKIKITKNNPSVDDIEKCKMFIDFEETSKHKTWNDILRYCQSSFINILEANYIVNQKEESGFVFLLDFNKSNVNFYYKTVDGITEQYNSATIEEIMEFDDMPTKNLTFILNEMKEMFCFWHTKYLTIEQEIEKMIILKQNTKKQGAVNIEQKLNKLIDDNECMLRELNCSRRVFYNRLKVLELIDETTNEE